MPRAGRSGRVLWSAAESCQLLPAGDPRAARGTGRARLAAHLGGPAGRGDRRGEGATGVSRPTVPDVRGAGPDDQPTCTRVRSTPNGPPSSWPRPGRCSPTSRTTSVSPGRGFLEFYIGMDELSCRSGSGRALRAEAHARAAGDDVLADMDAQLVGTGALLRPGPRRRGDPGGARRCSTARRASSAEPRRSDSSAGFLRCAARSRKRESTYEQGSRAHERQVSSSRLPGTRCSPRSSRSRAGAPCRRRGCAPPRRRRARPSWQRSYRGTTALLLADVLASRGEREEAARWCAEVRETLNEDDLVDVIAVNSLEGFLAAAAGSARRGRATLRPSGRGRQQRSTSTRRRRRAYEWHARTLALVGKPAEAREAAATALAIYEAKGDLPASAWARELLDSLSG